MKKKKNLIEKKRRAWVVGGALALAAIAIVLVTFYSGMLSLTAYRDTRPITQEKITTKIDCSYSNGTVSAVLSAPRATLSATHLDHLNIVWSTSNPQGYVQPTVSHTHDGGVAQGKYVSRGNGGATNTVRADFLGGFIHNGLASRNIGIDWIKFGDSRYYTPSSCTVPVSTVVVDPTPRPTLTPTPTITPIKDPTPKPTICPHVCRFVNGKLHCGCD